MAKEKIMQVVEDDEIENVGIMSGFMDDIDDFLSEIMEEEQEAMSGEDDEMARVTGRTPDSPEILMNNLRGNMRSLDARREELADMVGFSAAEETPDEVLAMLQPVLAQQDMAGIASMLSPPSSGSPRVNPELLAPPAPAGGVPSLPMAQGPMPMPPAAPAPAPMQMKHGGLVQHFQDGSTEEGVTAVSDVTGGRYPREMVELALPQIKAMLAEQPQPVPSLLEEARKLEPAYAELLGVDRDSAKAQFLMSLGQAALRYAGNVGPSGERLSGSPIARLAAGFSDVPAAAAKAGASIAAQERQARLAAIQGAQADIDAVRAYNTALRDRQTDVLTDIAKQKPVGMTRPMTEKEMDDYGITDKTQPWVIDEEGTPSIAGGRPPVPLVDMSEDKRAMFGLEVTAENVKPMYENARKAVKDIANIDDTIDLIKNSEVDTGFGAELRQNIRRVQNLFSDDPERVRTLSDTELLNSALGKEVFGAISDLGVGARGLDTPAEREFLREVVAGRPTLTKDTLLRMAAIRRKAAVRNIEDWNELLSSGRGQDLFDVSGFYSTEPIVIPIIPTAAKFDEGPGSDRRAKVLEILKKN